MAAAEVVVEPTVPRMIDTSQAVRRHVCELPPPILTFDEDDPGPVGAPNIVMAYPEGTRHTCDGCGRVRIVTWVVSPYINVMSGWEWVDETRRQRRRREGRRWWQR